MKKVLIGIGILIACFGIGFLYLASKPSVASNYTEVVETGGAVEKKYLGQGNYDVSYLEINALQNFKNMNCTILQILKQKPENFQ